MRKLLIGLGVLVAQQVSAQNVMVQDMHFQNMNFINAAAGIVDTSKNHDIQLYGTHRIVPGLQYDKAPTFLVNYIGKFEKIKGSINVGYVFDQYSNYTRNTVQVGYATHLKKGNHHFDIGARAVGNVDYVTTQHLAQVGFVEDKETRILPDLDFGFQYRVKGWTLGLSAKNIFGNSIGDVYVERRNERIFYMNASYEHTFGEKFKLAVVMLPGYTTSFQMDLGLNAKFWNRMDVSYMFRLKEIRHIYRVSGMITKSLYAGASFGHGHLNSDFRTQLMVGYRF